MLRIGAIVGTALFVLGTAILVLIGLHGAALQYGVEALAYSALGVFAVFWVIREIKRPSR